MKMYDVIIENNNGVWHAVIPSLIGISAKGESRDEALHRVWKAAETYLSKVELATIEIAPSAENLTPGSAKAVLKAAGKFVGDEEAMLRHIEEIYAERKREREEIERKIDLADSNGA